MTASPKEGDVKLDQSEQDAIRRLFGGKS
jgi:hypothetical protein